MGQIANQMLIETVFKLKEKLKEKKAEKNVAGVTSKKETKSSFKR